jgi:transcriptional regulator with XRE-family HTH domain
MRRLRRAMGLTQVELAERVGVASNSIARQERGEMGIREPLARLIRLLANNSQSAARISKGRRKA